MMKKVLIYCPPFLNKEPFQVLNNYDLECIFIDDEKAAIDVNEDEIFGVVCNNFFSYHDIAIFSNLRFVHLTSSGVDRVNTNYLIKHNIKLFNCQNVYSIPISEYVVGSILSLYKPFSLFKKNQEKHLWLKERNVLELNGKTVCIVGCGGIGSECAKRLKSFNCIIYGVDITEDKKGCFDKVVTISKIKDILKIADIIIISLPLTKETFHLFDDSLLQICKYQSILINVSRGAIIDQSALINNSNKFYGIVLDVFEEEPLDCQNEIWSLNNITISPHNSYVGENNSKRLSDLIITNIRHFLEENR